MRWLRLDLHATFNVGVINIKLNQLLKLNHMFAVSVDSFI